MGGGGLCIYYVYMTSWVYTFFHDWVARYM